MRVLLLGANGFIGRFVADRLLADPAVHLTALGRGDDADVRFDLASGSPGALTRFLDAVHPGVVVNCAGATRGGARDLTRHNTVAVATVCEALRRSGCGARLVQVGCASEYGPSQPGASTAEDAVPRPGGPYGVSKLAATELVLGSGLDAVVLRVFSPVGPGTPMRLAPRPPRRGDAPGHAGRGRRAQAQWPRGAAGLRRRTGRGAGRPRRLALRRPGRRQHRHRPRGPAPRRRRRPRQGRGLRRQPARAGRPARPAAAPDDRRPRTEGTIADQLASAPYPYPDGCGPWQQADVRTARDRLGWRPRINLEESLADIWMEAACRI